MVLDFNDMTVDHKHNLLLLYVLVQSTMSTGAHLNQNIW